MTAKSVDQYIDLSYNKLYKHIGLQMLTATKFTYSDYYKTGTITVKYKEREFVLDRDFSDDEFGQFLHELTFIMDDENIHYCTTRNQYLLGEYEFDDNDQPVGDDLNWLDQSDIDEHILDSINCYLADDAGDSIKTKLDEVILNEEADAAFTAKFANGPLILKTGYLTRLFEQVGGNEGHCTWATILGERNGEHYEDNQILAVINNLMITCDEDRTEFTVHYVVSDDAEMYSTETTFDLAVAAATENDNFYSNKII